MAQKRKPDAQPTHEAGEISGLPHSLPQGTLAALVENGTVVALASGDSLKTFRVESGLGHCAARAHTSYELPGRASALAESNFGILVAVEECESPSIYLARDNRLTVVCRAPGTVTALVAAGGVAYAVVRTGVGLQARLVQIGFAPGAQARDRPVLGDALQICHFGSLRWTSLSATRPFKRVSLV